jgi:hypothetical protein
MAFFELRQYRAQPGRRDDLVRWMEDVVIPFQSSKGMVIVGSWVGETEDDLYVWMRRFESEEQRKAQYDAVYKSAEWTEQISKNTGDFLDREKIVVTRIEATPRSILR